MRRMVFLFVLAVVVTGWSQGLRRCSDCNVPKSERDCWGSYANWRYKPKYGYVESIEKERAGDAEAKFCFARYCSQGKDENDVKIPKDEKRAGELLQASAEAGFGPAQYAMAGMIIEYETYMDRIGIYPPSFQNNSGKRNLGMLVGHGLYDKYAVVSNAVAKAMPYLRRAQKHGVPLTENYFKRLELMVRGCEQRERKVALNAELSDVAQKGDAKLVNSVKERIALLENEMSCDQQVLLKMDAEDRHAQEEARKSKEETERKRAQEERLCGAGIVKPFVPFNELERLSYEDCLAKAKENSASAYYWLAFYFAEGKQVEKDQSSAYKFLAKSSDMKYPQACYTVAQLHELWSLEDEDGCNVRDDEVRRRFPSVGFRWNVPELKGNRCLTNEVATSFVLNLYRDALKGGLLFATNDIARVEKNIAACKGRISKAEAEARTKRDKAQKALELLVDGDGVSEAAKAEDQDAEHAAAEEAEQQRRALREYWADWPRNVREGSSNYVAAVKAIEGRFNVALVDMNGTPKWKVGEGRSCIKYSASDGVYFEKYDADGRLVLVSNERSDFEELKAFDERREVLLKEEREVWAQTKGITYENAMSRSNEWQNVGFAGRRPLLGGLRRPGGLGSGLTGGGSLRARRLQRQQEAAAVAARQREELAAKDAERQAQAEQEKRQREAERAEQRQQLLAIQEELKRVRGEATSASKAEGRK